MALPSDTIALPIVKGLNVQTDARLLDAPALLEAENTQFSGGGAKKRRGHLGIKGRGLGDLVLNKSAGVRAEAHPLKAEPDTFAFYFYALEPGTVGNSYTVQFVADGMGTGTLVDGPNAVFHYQSGVTTVQDLINLGSAYWVCVDISSHTSLSGKINRAQTVHFSGGTDAPVWTYGAGVLSTMVRPAGEEDTLFWSSADPDIAEFHGVLTRDDETVLWDGFRLWSYLPSEADAQAPRLSEVAGAAVLPSLHATPLVKQSSLQAFPEYAENALTKFVAWIDTTTQKAHYAILDLVSGAQIASGVFSAAGVSIVRLFTLGEWMHAALYSGTDQKVYLYSINSKDPQDITFRDLGPCVHFDLWKCNESEAVLARASTDGIHVTWLTPIGTGSPTRTTFTHVPTSSIYEPLYISVAYDSTQDRLGLAWTDPTPQIVVAVLEANGSQVWEGTITIGASNVQRITLSSRTVPTSVGSTPFVVFWNNSTTLHSQAFWLDEGMSAVSTGTLLTRYRKLLNSRAFRIGDRVFCWAGHDSTIQSTWFLLDEALLPVGHMNFGTADTYNITGGNVCGVNWLDAEPYKVQLARGSKLRTAPSSALGAIYTEPYIQGVVVDFLPSLSAVQAGRSAYVPGAQLWVYDGAELVEAGFHLGPEPTLAQSAGGGLTAAGTYSYRVDVCHRNDQNEEVRSLSILTDSLVLSGGNNTITLTIPTVLTRREDSYFLIFRNAMEAGVPLTEWWLVNSRDPSDPTYRANDLTQDTVTFIDAGAVNDTVIQTRELHPATDTYLQPVAAPACEVLSSGRDRLWVAGGELAPGVLAPSRLFDSGEVPSFNAYLNIQVDRAVQPITALGFIGEIAVIFRKGATHILDSDGPDNVAQGLWNPPRLALADLGCVSQASLARLSSGLAFQSLAGFRLLGPGGSLQPLGVDIDKAIKDFTVVGTLVSERDQEVRFYGSGTAGAYVLNYLYGTWAHWSCGGAGVAKNSDSYAIIAREDGEVWIETPGIYKDGNEFYGQRLRTSWLHGGNLGDFQRVRRVGALGRFADTSDPNQHLRLEYYYDEREFWEERVEWDMPDASVNGATWGSGTWGAGTWGDTNSTISNLEDLTWEWVRRPSRQKCSAFSIALEEYDTSGPGFELSAFTFELARKTGLDRTPERTGTNTSR